MRLGIRAKLFLVSLALISGALLAADLLLTPGLDRILIARSRGDLSARAALIQREMPAGFAQPTPRWESLIRDLGNQAQVRLTLVDAQGRVLADSDLDGPGLRALENHGDRPEIREALLRGEGSSVRRSSTLGHRMLYLARPLWADGELLGYIRLSLPLSQVDHSVSQLRTLLIAASLVALAVSGLVSILAAHRLSRTLRALAHSAGRMVEGDLGTRTHTPGDDEIATLGKSLDHLADSLAQALSQLKSERDLLLGVLAGMQEGVLLRAPGGVILHANGAIRAMLDRACGTTALQEALTRAGLEALILKAEEGQLACTEELNLGGNPSVRVLAQVSPLPGEAGKLLVVLVDVTQLRRLESLRRDFVGNASHELRTPVASLRSAAETLRGAMGDPEAAQLFLGIIDRNAMRLHRLIDDLLDLTRIESQAYPLHPEALPLGEFLPPLCRSFEGMTRVKGMEIRLGPSSDLQVWADPQALEQVLGNLLDNAVKYGPNGSSIHLGARLEGHSVLLEVRDEGPGIPAEHLPRLFERFYRVDAGRSRELGGTGLGLAIVKHLTEGMGGSVQVASEPGKGSTFTLRLPTVGQG